VFDVLDVVAGYRLERPLGRGGMGVVYRARDERLKRWVALKVIAPEFASEESFRERFGRECRLAAAVDHPNLIPIYQAGEADGRLFLAMRLVEGTDLRTLIVSEGRLAPVRALRIVAQVAAGLDAAHERGLVHRDVKPQNILIVDAGAAEHVYLTDFGLARVAEDPTELTAPSGWVGTLDYVSPEQLRGDPVDRRADVYGLGCVLFEALTGHVPFSGLNAATKLLAHLSATPPRPSVELLGTVPELDAVIARALAKQPAQRFSTAGGLAAAARAAIEAVPTRAHDGSPVAARDRGEAEPGPPGQPTASPIPEPATPTFGRDDDVRAVAALLARPDVRCVTLTGTGGVGKTRLALEVARGVATSFRDGVRFAWLATVSTPGRVADSLTQQLGARPEGDEALAALLRSLAAKQLLLVVDNFEHVIGAAPVVEELRTRCPGVKVLATSREPLRLASEHVYQVAPLALPRRGGDLAELSGAPASALFIDRAKAQDPALRLTPADVRAISEICRRLDGVPLALELAAARTALLSPSELLERLSHVLTTLEGGPRDAPSRQRTLRATIDWSHDLLDEDERAAFAGLAVFAGGADLEAVETVTRADVGTIAALVAKNLAVRREGRDGRTRLYMLNTIREYAADRLGRRGDASALRTRHCRYYLELAEQAELGLRGRDQRAWAGRLDDELDNIRAAVAWSLREGHPELAVRLVAAIGVFLGFRRGRLGEVREWLEAALSAAHRLPRRVHAKACLALAVALQNLGETEAALRRCREAMRLYRKAGDTAGLADSLAEMSFMEFESSTGDSRRAAAAAAEALELARASGDGWVTVFALCANIWHVAPDLAAAKRLADEALAIARELGDHNQQSMVLSNIGFAALEEGDYAYARRAITEAAVIHRTAVDDVAGSAVVLGNLGLVATLEGDDRALDALHEALRTCLEHGLARPLSEVLVATAALAARAGDHPRAARLCGAAAAMACDAPTRTDRKLEAEARESAQAALGEDGWQREWDRGHGLRFEEAIVYALAEPDPAAARA
jgi:non-specific serine/threonine protein kinase